MAEAGHHLANPSASKSTRFRIGRRIPGVLRGRLILGWLAACEFGGSAIDGGKIDRMRAGRATALSKS